MALPQIPVISSFPGVQQWKKAIDATSVSLPTPRIPWNFQVSSKQGGNLLSWQAVNGADGYRVEFSDTGDFSTGVGETLLMGNQNVSYFDPVSTSGGAAPAKRYYRVRATAGNANNPQVIIGPSTGVLSSSAIAPNDTVTVSTTSTDTTTNDFSQTKAGPGDYRNILPRE